MLTFQELKRRARLDASQFPRVRLAVLGDCATQMLSTAIIGSGYEHGLDLEIFDADYDQIDAQVIDPASELYRFAPDAVLLVMCTEKLYEAFCSCSGEKHSCHTGIYGYFSAILLKAMMVFLAVLLGLV